MATAFHAAQQWCNIDGVLEAVGSCVMVLTIAQGAQPVMSSYLDADQEAL